MRKTFLSNLKPTATVAIGKLAKASVLLATSAVFATAMAQTSNAQQAATA